jgi:hypothetical protein
VRLRPRAAPVDPSTLPEDLGVDWSRWSDGRAHRLKRKKDFPNVNPGLARTACAEAATSMGKVARTVRDRMIPHKLIWVQFADYEIREGEPCPRCGSRRILRLHAGFGRCPQCNAQLILSHAGLEALADEADDDGSARQRAKMAAKLRDLTGVHLGRSGETRESELYNGYAEQDGDLVIVLAEFDLGEKELSPENLDDRVRLVKVLPPHLFEGLVDVNELAARAEADWDLVL